MKSRLFFDIAVRQVIEIGIRIINSRVNQWNCSARRDEVPDKIQVFKTNQVLENGIPIKKHHYCIALQCEPMKLSVNGHVGLARGT
jgi:hypothetical protein